MLPTKLDIVPLGPFLRFFMFATQLAQILKYTIISLGRINRQSSRWPHVTSLVILAESHGTTGKADAARASRPRSGVRR